MALVEYAHKKITADGIENVVVDLSNNGGGEIDACMYITAWMVGQAEINIVDAVTGSTVDQHLQSRRQHG
jgi:C-terminal processing protease CtpA/Prc